MRFHSDDLQGFKMLCQKGCPFNPGDPPRTGCVGNPDHPYPYMLDIPPLTCKNAQLLTRNHWPCWYWPCPPRYPTICFTESERGHIFRCQRTLDDIDLPPASGWHLSSATSRCPGRCKSEGRVNSTCENARLRRIIIKVPGQCCDPRRPSKQAWSSPQQI